MGKNITSQIPVHNVNKYSPYHTEITLRQHDKDQSPVLGNNFACIENHKKHINMMRAQTADFCNV
jgi:hypothetical protein